MKNFIFQFLKAMNNILNLKILKINYLKGRNMILYYFLTLEILEENRFRTQC